MFLSETHLPQLLRPEVYFDAEWHRTGIQAWQSDQKSILADEY